MIIIAICNMMTDVQVSRRNSHSYDKLPIGIRCKIKVNLFEKPAIYVYLTNLSI